MEESLHHSARRARAEIASGTLRGQAFLERLLSIPFLERDAWVDAVLGIEDLPTDDPELPREAVPYLPCGVEEILAMVNEVPLNADHEFVDLGSGLGRVAILAHLISRAPTRGLEIQEHLVRGSNALRTELGLSGVTFTRADVTETELEGSVFFLYAPFSGEMLARAVQRLELIARRRPIVICAVGLELRDFGWLKPRSTSSLSLTLYDSIRT